MARRFNCLQPSRRRALAAGFTLVELMVSMTGGLFLTIALYALSRDASYLYQRETRVANATLNGVAGFERMASDISRAGHMSTPNIMADPRVCNRPDNTWPAGAQNLRAIAITTDGASAAGTELATANVSPHTITISGALDTTEELYTNSIEPIANGFSVSINRATPAALRLGLQNTAAAVAANQAVLTSVFMADSGNAGRIVRLRKDGSEQYGVVASVSSTATMSTLVLLGNPALQFRVKADVAQCGIDGVGSGYSLSVINVVRYSIKSLRGVAAYNTYFAATDAPIPSDAGRAELVRVELNASGQELLGTQELIAEYAVDLRFAPWAATSPANPALLATDPAAYNSTDVAATPELLRGIHVRLGVRSREPDRLENIAVGGAPAYRMPVQGGGFARMRVMQTDIPLRNLENANWQP